MKKPFILGLSLFASLFLGANAFAAAKYTMRVAYYFPTSHPAHTTLEMLRDNVAKETNGQLQLELFPNNQLGNEETFIDSIKRGIVQMAVSGGLIKKDEVKLSLVEPPFVFESWKQAKAAYTGPIGQKIVGDYTKNTGVMIVGYSVNGFREISCNFPLKTMDDLKKMKIRVPTNEIYVKMFNGFGANTVMMPMGEIYSALETKVVDGQDNPYSTVKAAGWWEVQKYMLESRHMFVANPWLVNKKFFDGLPADIQKVFLDNVKKAIDFNWEISEKDDLESRDFIASKGVQIIEASPELRQAMKDSLKDFYEWYYDFVPGSREIIKEMEALPR
ncbi:MAG: TRAP transporter substrate-binding protein [Candidatus Accumulibacter sp.]|jgi:tripartite ATP-independent transporter DctP family solute receptor|nr:TRAP transporter substrate-binding protein [Accumulibacter sp.]